MKLLLDTHALLWWLTGNSKLSRRIARAIENQDNEIVVSAASAWEIATKSRLGKLPEAIPLAQRIPELVAAQGFIVTPVTIEDGHRAGWLESRHRDPFDRMLAAQAIALDIPVATRDAAFVSLGAKVIW